MCILISSSHILLSLSVGYLLRISRSETKYDRNVDCKVKYDTLMDETRTISQCCACRKTRPTCCALGHAATISGSTPTPFISWHWSPPAQLRFSDKVHSFDRPHSHIPSGTRGVSKKKPSPQSSHRYVWRHGGRRAVVGWKLSARRRRMLRAERRN